MPKGGGFSAGGKQPDKKAEKPPEPPSPSKPPDPADANKPPDPAGPPKPPAKPADPADANKTKPESPASKEGDGKEEQQQGQPNPNNPNLGTQPKKPVTNIVMRYYPVPDFQSTETKKALSRMRGVDSVEIDTDARTITVGWQRKCSELHELESAAAKAGAPALAISHVHMILTFKPIEGADPKTLEKELFAVKGVKGICAEGLSAELHTDIRDLDIEDLRAAAKTAGYEMQFKSHRWIEAKVTISGDATIDGVRKEIERIPGALVVNPNGDTLGFWTVAAIGEGVLRTAAKRAGGSIEIRYP